MSEEFKFNPLFVVDDSSYFDKLKNDSLIKVFEREENIGKLESLIYKRKRKLDLVRSEIDGEDIEPRRISKEELSDKFDEICQDVDDFLGIDLSLRPKIGFTNYFSSKTNGISNYLGLTFILASTISIPFAQMLTEYEHLPLSLRVAQVAFSIFGIKSFVDYSNIKGMFDPRNNEIKMDSKDESLVQFMAHEYAHFVQGYLLKDEKKQSQDFLIFREGHAIGVQNFISRKYFDDSSDRSQLEMNLKLNLSFLKTAYGGLCEKFNQEPKNEILSKGSLNMYQSYAHSIGCALFSLYEDKLGDRIYLDVLNGEFDPSLLLE